MPRAVSASAPAPSVPLSFARAWRRSLTQPRSRRGWLVLVGLLFGVVVPRLAYFFHYIQQRSGPLLPDPLLALLPRHDVAVPIFVLMYGSVIAAVTWLFGHPQLLLRGLWGYLLLLLFRLAAVWLLPLSPPLDLLDMPDPFLARLYHGVVTEPITRDLFFSGHTATVALLALGVRGRWWRTALWVATVAVGLLVLVQRVHYSYDVLAAPLFAWLAYWMAGRIVGTQDE